MANGDDFSPIGSVRGLLVSGDLISNFFRTAAISSLVMPSSLITGNYQHLMISFEENCLHLTNIFAFSFSLG